MIKEKLMEAVVRRKEDSYVFVLESLYKFKKDFKVDLKDNNLILLSKITIAGEEKEVEGKIVKLDMEEKKDIKIIKIIRILVNLSIDISRSKAIRILKDIEYLNLEVTEKNVIKVVKKNVNKI